MHQNVNDSLITPRVITHPPSEAFSMSMKEQIKYGWLGAVLHAPDWGRRCAGATPRPFK